MPEESEHATQRIADDGAPQVSDVHRFGDIRRREIDDIGPRDRHSGHTQAFISGQLGSFFGETRSPEAQIDETLSGYFGGFAKIRHIEFFDQCGSDFKRRFFRLIS